MTDAFLEQLKQAATDDSVDMTDFVRLVFEQDPTDENWHDALWPEVLPLIKSKLPKQNLYTVTVAQAARAKRCSSQEIQSAIKAGALDAHKQGSWLIHEQSLQAWTPSPYTMTVAQAAEQKNCHVDTIRKAIKRGEIDARKQGSWRINPKSLKSWNLQEERSHERTKTNTVHMRYGHLNDLQCAVRVDGLKVDLDKVQHVEQTIKEVTLDQWTSIGVYTTSPGRNRFLELVPGLIEQSFEFHGFYIKGFFDYKTKINNRNEATQAWSAYKKV